MKVTGIIEEVKPSEYHRMLAYKFLIYDENDYKRTIEVYGDRANYLINRLITLVNGTLASDIEGMIVVLEVDNEGYVEYIHPISTASYNKRWKGGNNMTEMQDLKNEIKFDKMVISGLQDSVKIKKRRISELEKEIIELKNELDNAYTLLYREKMNKDRWREYAFSKYKDRKGAQS